jgi:hypothetical protein
VTCPLPNSCPCDSPEIIISVLFHPVCRPAGLRIRTQHRVGVALRHPLWEERILEFVMWFGDSARFLAGRVRGSPSAIAGRRPARRHAARVACRTSRHRDHPDHTYARAVRANCLVNSKCAWMGESAQVEWSGASTGGADRLAPTTGQAFTSNVSNLRFWRLKTLNEVAEELRALEG